MKYAETPAGRGVLTGSGRPTLGGGRRPRRGVSSAGERTPQCCRQDGEASADRLVEPLVIEGAFERVQLLPELLGVRGHDAGIEGLAVAPALVEGEVVRAVVLLQHIKPQIAVVLARGDRQ